MIAIRGHVHMTSALGGGEGGDRKEDENGQGGEGGQANLDVIFLDDVNSVLPPQKCSKRSFLTNQIHFNSNPHAVFCIKQQQLFA